MRATLWAAMAANGVWLGIGLSTGTIAPRLVMAVSLALVIFMGMISVRLAMRSQAEITLQEQAATEAERQRLQTELLFNMTDMLQSAQNHEDAGQVLEATASQLLPELRGALYIFNNSCDRLERACFWPLDGISDPSKALVPDSCWALKRGKMHINDPHAGALCCKHNNGVMATIEVPMVARNTVHGLLMLATDRPDGAAFLRANARLAQALADSISLALANIALQDRLRTQSLRDPLTGLYNRRYMEDALERYVSMAERSGSSTAGIMIDLDQFKALNDTHGHAKGDSVLRDVAAQLVSALRPADVVSRYGGEELFVILPGCDLDDAMLKAEMLRSRIEGLSESHGVAISASLGVAAIPETAHGPRDLLAMADAALYTAKREGRNCVRAAPRRADRAAAAQTVATALARRRQA